MNEKWDEMFFELCENSQIIGYNISENDIDISGRDNNYIFSYTFHTRRLIISLFTENYFASSVYDNEAFAEYMMKMISTFFKIKIDSVI